MKKLVLFYFVILTITANAQPVLTAINTNPIVGDGFHWIYGNNVSSPGIAGANQTWDFSTLGTLGSTQNDTVIPASSAISAADYPNANIAIQNINYNRYFFYKTSSDSLVNYGIKGASYQGISSDPTKLLLYPFSYNSTFNDTQYSNENNGGTLYYTSGSSTTLADGYGTLILPSGSFSNVLRVKIVGSTFSSNTSTTTNYTYYYFYLPGIHQPILKLILSGSSYQPTYLKMSTTGIDETNISLNKFNLFPNPASNNIKIETSNPSSIEILNLKGQLLMNINEVNNSANIDISTFAKGLYFVKFISNECIEVKKFIKE